MMYNIRSGAVRWQIYDFLCGGYSNVCSSSHRLRDIRKTKNIQMTLKMKINVKEEKSGTRLSTINIRFYIGDFFQNFS